MHITVNDEGVVVAHTGRRLDARLHVAARTCGLRDVAGVVDLLVGSALLSRQQGERAAQYARRLAGAGMLSHDGWHLAVAAACDPRQAAEVDRIVARVCERRLRVQVAQRAAAAARAVTGATWKPSRWARGQDEEKRTHLRVRVEVCHECE